MKFLRSLSPALTRQYATKPKKDSYDAIIVGGGHNGLISAAYLAKSGLR